LHSVPTSFAKLIFTAWNALHTYFTISATAMLVSKTVAGWFIKLPRPPRDVRVLKREHGVRGLKKIRYRAPFAHEFRVVTHGKVFSRAAPAGLL